MSSIRGQLTKYGIHSNNVTTQNAHKKVAILKIQTQQAMIVHNIPQATSNEEGQTLRVKALCRITTKCRQQETTKLNRQQLSKPVKIEKFDHEIREITILIATSIGPHALKLVAKTS